MNKEDFAQKLSFEVDSLINDLMSPDQSEGPVQAMQKKTMRMAIYSQAVNPVIKKAQKDGPAELIGYIKKIRDSCNRLLEGFE